MRDFMILTDVCADLTPEMLEEFGVVALPMDVTVGETTFRYYPDAREYDMKEFYRRVRAGEKATTSQVTQATFEEYFTEYLEKDMDIIYLAFSSGLSGSYASSVAAADLLREKYPEAKIYTVDTLCASLGEGLIVYHASQMKAAGSSMEEIRDFVVSNHQSFIHWFTVDDLNHLRRGGRLSAGAALAGTLLGIKPVLHVDAAGHLVPVSKARGRRASIGVLFDHLCEQVKNLEEVVFISHADCADDVKLLENAIRDKYPKMTVRIGLIGPIVGAHSGPGTIALFYTGANRDV